MRDPKPAEAVVRTTRTGVFAGAEKLLRTGRMPMFPGMGDPLVPGCETVGELVEAGPESGRRVGELVFVAGADCHIDVRPVRQRHRHRHRQRPRRGAKVVPLGAAMGAEATLLALAATARHAIAAPRAPPPDLIVGHGALGRLLARLTLAAGGAPTV